MGAVLSHQMAWSWCSEQLAGRITLHVVIGHNLSFVVQNLGIGDLSCQAPSLDTLLQLPAALRHLYYYSIWVTVPELLAINRCRRCLRGRLVGRRESFLCSGVPPKAG